LKRKSFRFLVEEEEFQVSGFRFLVEEEEFQVSGFRFLVEEEEFQVSGFFCNPHSPHSSLVT
jgi:hypothetical protein